MSGRALRIIITGGTFDKRYDELRGVLSFKDSHLPEIVRQVRLTYPVELQITQLVDSLEMDDSGRAAILTACHWAPEQAIVITHGTDRMVETARILGAAALPKTIVLTGAMVPFAVAGSDALFNLGGAVLAAQLAPPGVWLAMNGQLFPWDGVRKDFERGVFVDL